MLRSQNRRDCNYSACDGCDVAVLAHQENGTSIAEIEMIENARNDRNANSITRFFSSTFYHF